MQEIIVNVINYIQTHWADLAAIYLSVVGAASVIVKLTPTLKDDDVLKNVIRFVGKYIALNTSKGTTNPTEPK